MNARIPRLDSLAAALVLLVPVAASAQSGFAGVVRDTTGGVLPGVTVEATSPALIEKVRTVVTDSQGVYRIVDLRPGRYNITFSLAGFSSLIREGIDLPATFTATVNVEMRVGTVQETVTVSGSSPAVDVQNVTVAKTLTQDVIDAIPAARTPQHMAILTPGMTAVGLGGIPGGREELHTSIHGGRNTEAAFLIDGATPAFSQAAGGAAGYTYRISQSFVGEMTIVMGGGSAEQPHGGTVTNVIPKEGSNRFSGNFYAEYANSDLQSNNLTENLKARGLASTTELVKMWDVSPAFGGPILEDQLWFFGSLREQGVIQTRAGLFENLTPKGWKYTPDLSRPAVIKLTDQSRNARLTWQASQKHKISVFGDIQPHTVWQRNYQFNVSPEATTPAPYLPNAFFQATWKAPLTNRLLLEAGATSFATDWNVRRAEGVGFDTVAAVETTTNLLFRASAPVAGGSHYGHNISHAYRFKGSASYITGSHNFKSGVQFARGDNTRTWEPNGDVLYSLRNGVPISLTQYATPSTVVTRMKADLGLFAQEQWTIRRMTLNVGARYDYYNGQAAPTDLPAGQFMPAQRFDAVGNLPNWHDLSPRLGVSYDLFGNGKTAFKASLGRFVQTEGTSGLANANHPVNKSVVSVSRTWTDGIGDFVPNCDLTNPRLNGECGQISDLNFGRANPSATSYAQDVLEGFGVRGYDWQSSVELQRELRPGVSVVAGYYRTSFSNFTQVDNLSVTPADFDPFCITAPVDPRLPGGGGNQVCGLYDVKPASFGQVLTLVARAQDYGERTEVYNGLDLTGNARLPRGALVSGGVSIGRVETDACFVVDSPQALLHCNIKPPFQPNWKFYGVYPLPWGGLQASAVYQWFAGRQITAAYQAGNAEVVPKLKRNLAQGVNGTVIVPLIQPGTMYSESSQQVDTRVTKRFKIDARRRVQVTLDVFNLFNASGVQDMIFTYGPSWQRPLLIQQGRFLKFTTLIDF